MLNQESIDFIGRTIYFGALDFMAAKAGVSRDDIAAALRAPGADNVRRYFADLVRAGVDNVPAMLDDMGAAARAANPSA